MVLNTLELTFVSPDYFNKGRNEYQYQLKNYDKTWIKAGQINFARYTKLPPGDYTFMVQSSNCHFWNTNSKTLAIKIFPPWWRTYWAYLLYAVLSIVLLYTVYQFLINKKLAAAENNRLLELEIHFTRSVVLLRNELHISISPLLDSKEIKCDENFTLKGVSRHLR